MKTTDFPEIGRDLFIKPEKRISAIQFWRVCSEWNNISTYGLVIMPSAQSSMQLLNPGDSYSGYFVATHTHTHKTTFSEKDKTFQLHQEKNGTWSETIIKFQNSHPITAKV